MSFRTVLLLVSMIVAATVHADPARFVERSVLVDGHTYRYQVFLPTDWAPTRHWPVVLFLHGSGEAGDDNKAQLAQGLPPWLREHGKDFPAVVVMPQAPKNVHWSGQAEAMAMQALHASIEEFHGDRHRLYLTGLSLGGFGAWQFALDHPNVFAAAAIICGGIQISDPEDQIRLIGLPEQGDPYVWTARHVKLPIWLFHGAVDPVVPPGDDHKLYAALKAEGTEVRFTEFPGVGHGSWLPAYATPELWPWMFSHRLAKPSRWK